jgi:predicted transcriptional regulator
VREALAQGPATAAEVARRMAATAFLSEVSSTLLRLAKKGEVRASSVGGRRVYRLVRCSRA